ncbi:MAG: transglutaminase-like domain-containing protein, partial [Lachnospiraceae bacterium]|nr:transglutaminase-like domain-containing protein [Lachnospiraceae bacterium]
IKAFIKSGKDGMSVTSVWAWPGDIDVFNMDIIKDWRFTGDSTFTPYMYDTSKDSQQPTYYNLSNGVIEYLMAMDSQEMKLHRMENSEEYTAFVYSNYLQVPYGLSRLKAFADEIITVSDLGLECAAVKNAICRDTRYSQHLNVLPAGEEYIEYFLFNQKRGYCEHYATAGTVLLRLKGVPARYVSGYFIRPSEFNAEYDKSGNEKYVAYVKDYNAHAWTEVYKAGFGWLPFDMTNTISDENYNSGINLQPDVNGDAQEDLTQDILPANTEPDGLLDEGNIGNENFQGDIDIEEETGTEEEDNNIPGKKDKAKTSKKKRFKFTKELLIIILILLIASAPVIYIRAGFRRASR